MDRINADLLRTFVEVAKVEHLSRAAEALQADQSTVSRKVARLEQEVGVLLFERIGRNIRLTQAGRRLVGRAERILVEGASKRDAGVLLGRTASNKVVHAPVPAGHQASQYAGTFLDVRIEEAQTWFLMGTIDR